VPTTHGDVAARENEGVVLTSMKRVISGGGRSTMAGKTKTRFWKEGVTSLPPHSTKNMSLFLFFCLSQRFVPRGINMARINKGKEC